MTVRLYFAFFVQVSVVLCSPKPFDELVVPQPLENVEDGNVVQAILSYLETTTQSLRLEIDSLKTSMSAIQHKHSEEMAKQRQQFQRELKAIRHLCENRQGDEIEDPDHADNTTSNKVTELDGMFKTTDNIQGSLPPQRKPEATTEIDINEEGQQKDLHQNSISVDHRQPLRRDSKRAINKTHVAFFAKLSNHVLHLGQDQTVVFDNVVTNVGNGYDKNVGVFKAPVAGVYIFSTTITTYQDNNGHFGVYINQRRETWFILTGSALWYDKSSQTLIVHLNAGDDVTVRSILDSDHGAQGQEHSVFSGALLFEDSNEESVTIGK